jgi:catechol 2,3-dioxygenase-like lactoylglutathione lyase family enzyme
LSVRAALGMLLLALAAGVARAEVPGLRGMDHVGLTVPDLAQAEAFFARVLGCETLARNGPLSAPDDWLARHVGVDARAEIRAMALLRCAPGANLELFEWSAPDQDTAQPRNSDHGGHHVSFYVDDIQAAAQWLRAQGVETYDGPFTTETGEYAGQWVLYFRTPWGAHLELVSYPQGMGYERGTDTRLWDPRAQPAARPAR